MASEFDTDEVLSRDEKKTSPLGILISNIRASYEFTVNHLIFLYFIKCI